MGKKKNVKKECWMCVNCSKEVPAYCYELAIHVHATDMSQAEDCAYFDKDETTLEALEEG